jgi:hypothetical protein
MRGVGLSRRRADWEIIGLALAQADPRRVQGGALVGFRGKAPAAGGVKTGDTRY